MTISVDNYKDLENLVSGKEKNTYDLYQDGYKNGYENGYKDGYKDGRKDALSLDGYETGVSDFAKLLEENAEHSGISDPEQIKQWVLETREELNNQGKSLE